MSLKRKKGVAVVEWEASPAGDVIADTLIALLMHAQSSAASIRLTSKPCRHSRSDESQSGDEAPSSKKARSDGEEVTESRLRFIKNALKDQFETVEAVYEGNVGTFEITTDSGLESGTTNEDGVLTCTAKVAFDDSAGSTAEISVECQDQKLATNVRECLRGLTTAFAPIS